MKHVDKVNMSAKHYSLVSDYCMPDYSPREYGCPRCGTRLKLKQARVLYCRKCRKGFLHPRYDFEKDCII